MLRKQALLSTIALAALGCSALAADLPVRTAAPAPVFVAPVFTWAGFYVGANVGGAWGNDTCGGFAPILLESSDEDAIVGWPSSCGNNNNDVGLTGGVQAGYNWQVGSFVFGLEGDVNALSNGDDRSIYVDARDGVEPGNLKGIFAGRGGGSANWLATLRARVGIAADRALFYVTAGVAFTDSQRAQSVYFWRGPNADMSNDPDAIFTSSGKSDSVGWALGAGMEYAFSNNWSAKIEYLYARFDGGGSNYACADLGGQPNRCTPLDENYRFVGRNDNRDVSLVRVGLNYRFGGPAYAAPVVARY